MFNTWNIQQHVLNYSKWKARIISLLLPLRVFQYCLTIVYFIKFYEMTITRHQIMINQKVRLRTNEWMSAAMHCFWLWLSDWLTGSRPFAHSNTHIHKNKLNRFVGSLALVYTSQMHYYDVVSYTQIYFRFVIIEKKTTTTTTAPKHGKRKGK